MTSSIPLPGFEKPTDIYLDPRFRWVNETQFKLRNPDKEAGWEGEKVFYHCEKTPESGNLHGRWAVPHDDKFLELNSDLTGRITRSETTQGIIVASKKIKNGLELVAEMCGKKTKKRTFQLRRDLVSNMSRFYFKEKVMFLRRIKQSTEKLPYSSSCQ